MKLSDILLCILLTLLWGFNYVVVKVAVDAFDPMTAMALRYIAVSLMLLPLIIKIPRHLYIPVAKVGLVFGVLYFGLFFFAAKEVSASLASVILLLQTPFSLMCAMLFLKEPPSFSAVGGTVIAFVVVFLAIGKVEWQGSLLAIVLLILAAASWGYFNMMVRCLKLQIDPLSLNGGIALFSLPFFLIAMFCFEPHPLIRLTSSGVYPWFSILYMALIATIFCYSTWFKLIHRYNVAMVSPFMLLTAVFGVLTSRLFLHEPLEVHLILGAVVALVGVGWVVLPSSIRAFAQRRKKVLV